MPLLSVRDAGRRVGDRWLWRGLSFGLAPGDRLGITGPSGSGKTLLLRALVGLDDLDEGEVVVEDRALAEWDMPRLRMHLRYLAQTPALGSGTVREALAAPAAFASANGAGHDDAWVRDRLASLGRPAAFLDADVTTLSGGERQIAALLRVLRSRPQVLLLDEPTASLDPEATEAVETLVADWLGEDPQRARVWTSYDPAQRERVTSRTLRLA